MNSLRIKNLSSGYEKQKTIIEDISFEIKSGHFTCILGPNGSGKSTLLKSILALIPVYSGQVILNNQIDVLKLSEEERAKFLAYIPQAHTPPFPYSVIDVVRMGRTPHLDFLSRETEKDVEIANYYMDLLDIFHLKDMSYNKLSGGQRQLVLIARALTQQAQFLIMDEPTNSLDYGNQYKMLEIVSKLCKKMNLGVLMVSHEPQHCSYVADEIILIKNGKIIDIGDVNKIIQAEKLSYLYDFEISVHNIKVGNKDRKICIPKN